jgi:molybdate transport system substrate-binding protein
MVTAIGDEFERATGHRLDLNFGTAGAMRRRVETGEVTDLVILPTAMIAALEKNGSLFPGSIDLGRTVTGVAVREDADVPDISTPEAFKQALLDARAVAYADPQGGGSAGIFFVDVLNRLGIAEAVSRKAVLVTRGHEAAEAVADGRAEIGSTFISEILRVKGAKVVGPLPGDLYNVNTYTAGIHAGSPARETAAAFRRALTDPASRSLLTAAGLEPAFP